MTLNRTTGDHRNVTFYTASAALLPSVDDVAIFANLTAPASCVLPTPALANPAQEPAEGDVFQVQTDASATANPVTVTAPGSSINAAASLVLGGNQLATFTWSNDLAGYLASVATATGGAAVPVTFVVDPAAAPLGNVYTTLLAAAAARRLVTGPAIVTFRASMIHPAAVYDFRDASGDWNTTFGSNGGFRSEQFASGSTLLGVTTFELPVNFLGLPGEVLITAPAPGGSSFTLFRVNIGIGGIAATGGGDFFDASNVVGQNTVWILKEAAGLFQVGGNILCARGANASLFIIPLDDTTIAQNTLVESAGGLSTVTQAAPGALVNRTQAKLVTSGPNLNAVPGGNLNLTSAAANIKGPNGGNPVTQAGPAKIDGVTGKSPFIAATITASSRITGFLRDPLGAALTTGYGALPGDRMLGVAGAGGGFQLSAFLAGGPGTNVADGSDLDWEVTN